MSITDSLVPLLPKVRIPGVGDNVYKEEGCFSFDTPKCEDGLYVCMTTFLGFNRKFAQLYHEVTGNKLFLHMKQVKKEVPVKPEEKSPVEKKKPKRLAIGIEGGFTPDNDNKVEYDDVNELVILPEYTVINLEDIEDIPSVVLASVSAILSSTSASKKEDELSWDGEIRSVSKHAMGLKQLDNGVKIPPSGWKCSKCDLTKNLWLNLTDGEISCGRRYFDGTGGNNHGIEHFKVTQYPLAVKLGTITHSGADVHSYDEDTMVEDPKLAQHLSHFGINMMNMEKTEQTMTELEIELNERVGNEWDIIQESGKSLKPLRGPGLVGLDNMGNTCYMNSVMQVLYTIPEFQDRYCMEGKCKALFVKKLATLANLESSGWSDTMVSNEIQKRVSDASSDFTIQLCKLGLAMYSPEIIPTGNSAHENKEMTSCSVTPRTMKRIVGKGHVEFSTNRQQDAHEFLLHVLSVIERGKHKNGGTSPGEIFRFMVEDRIECQASKQVRYTKRSDYALALPIPLEAATNKAAVEEYQAVVEANKKDVNVKIGQIVRPVVPFTACIDSFAQDELIQDFWSSAVKEKAEAKKRTRFVTFPDHLVVQMKKFTIGDDWTPKKLDVSVEMPDTLNLNELRASGLQKDETLLPDIEPPPAPPSEPLIDIDEEAVVAISQMGFPLSRCRAALVATGNMGVEPAVMWLMENNSDANEASTESNHATDDNISSIVAMGFTQEQAKKALKATNNNLERAADWIFSHIDELDSIEVDSSEPTNQDAAGDVPMDTTNNLKDGSGNYELYAFISHMGSSTICGHYVCHIKKDGRWVIFNDEKVAESEQPPKDLGYMYFYKRV